MVQLIDFGMAYLPKSARRSSNAAETWVTSASGREGNLFARADDVEPHQGLAISRPNHQQEMQQRYKPLRLQRHHWQRLITQRSSSSTKSRSFGPYRNQSQIAEGSVEEVISSSEIMGTECFVAPEVLREQQYTTAVE
jgi:serine/threonine protein kinase